MIETIEWIWKFGSFIEKWYSWFKEPSVYPYIGVFAAIIAAFSIDSKGWIDVSKIIRRIVRITVIWLAIIILFQSFINLCGDGGSGGDSQKKNPSNQNTGPDVKVGEFIPRNKFSSSDVLYISFLPSEKEKEAKKFSICFRIKDNENEIIINQKSNLDLIKELEDKLKKALTQKVLASVEHLKEKTAVIDSTFFPGNGTLIKIQTLLKEILPKDFVVKQSTADGEDDDKK